MILHLSLNALRASVNIAKEQTFPAALLLAPLVPKVTRDPILWPIGCGHPLLIIRETRT